MKFELQGSVVEEAQKQLEVTEDQIIRHSTC